MRSAFERAERAWYPAWMEVEVSDGELVRAIARAGVDARAAEATLCRRFAPRIRAYGLRHLRDSDRANDLVQVVLIGLLEAARAERIQDENNVQRFVLGICRNSSIRMRERAAAATPAAPEELAHIASTTAPAEELALSALANCFARLEARAKEVLLLSFQEGHGALEIAERLAMSAVHVRVLRHRALSALRQCLDTGAEPTS